MKKHYCQNEEHKVESMEVKRQRSTVAQKGPVFVKSDFNLLIFPVWGALSLESLCNLYNWRYKKLGNLPHVQLLPEFSTANAGLLYDFQLINVEDFQGVGESEPNPYFYQVRKKHKTFKFILHLAGGNTT